MNPTEQALRKAAEAATPGPWRWELSLSSQIVELCGGPPKSGFGKFDLSVMSFRRWGMNKAAPVFWSWRGNAGDPKRADELSVPVEGREHHASWFRDIDHPNARFIALANPAAILDILNQLEASRAREERLKEALGPFAEAFWTLSSRWQDHEDHWQSGLHRKLTVAHLRKSAATLKETNNG